MVVSSTYIPLRPCMYYTGGRRPIPRRVDPFCVTLVRCSFRREPQVRTAVSGDGKTVVTVEARERERERERDGLRRWGCANVSISQAGGVTVSKMQMQMHGYCSAISRGSRPLTSRGVYLHPAQRSWRLATGTGAAPCHSHT